MKNNEKNYGNGKSDPRPDPTQPDPARSADGPDPCPSLLYSIQLTTPLLLYKPCKRFASVARVCQLQLAFLVFNYSVFMFVSVRSDAFSVTCALKACSSRE